MPTFLSKMPWRSGSWGLLVMLLPAMACELTDPRSLSAPLAATLDPPSVDTHVPFPFASVNPCTGEAFSGGGFIHFKIYLTSAPNFHISVEENLEDVKGVTVTGVSYVVPAQTSDQMISDQDFAPSTGTFEEMEQFIRQAEDGTLIIGDDFYLRMSFHFTVNANGVPTASFTDATATCK
jgi:hypothetical protein